MAITDNKLTLAAGVRQEFQVHSRYLRIREASAEVTLEIDTRTPIIRGRGEQIDLGLRAGDGVRVGVTSAVAQTITIIAADDPQWDDRQNPADNQVAIANVANKYTNLAKVSVPANSTVQIAAANPKRISLRVTNLSTSAGPVFLGEVGLVTGQGGPLEEGVTDFLDSTAALYAFNPHATLAVDVYLLDMSKQ